MPNQDIQNQTLLTRNVAVAEQILSKTFEREIHLGVPEVAGKGSNRARVYRCKVVESFDEMR